MFPSPLAILVECYLYISRKYFPLLISETFKSSVSYLFIDLTSILYFRAYFSCLGKRFVPKIEKNLR